jgi:cytosine/uracil/thiamine/allantoin permease
MDETGLRILRFLVACVAAVVFVSAGQEMRGITSVSGDSIAEAFYHSVGLFCYGMAILSLSLGISGGVHVAAPPTGTTNAAPHSQDSVEKGSTGSSGQP